MKTATIDDIAYQAEDFGFAKGASFPSQVPNYYERLGLDDYASEEDVKSSWKKLLIKWHPDRFIDPEKKAVAETQSKALGEAYHVLTEPRSRLKFDRALSDARLIEKLRENEKWTEEHLKKQQDWIDELQRQSEIRKKEWAERERQWDISRTQHEYSYQSGRFTSSLNRTKLGLYNSATFLGMGGGLAYLGYLSPSLLPAAAMGALPLVFSALFVGASKSDYADMNGYYNKTKKEAKKLESLGATPDKDLPKRSKTIDFLFMDVKDAYRMARNYISQSNKGGR